MTSPSEGRLRRLHEIRADFLALEELLLEAGGEITPEAEELMGEMASNLEAKVDGYAALIAEWEAEAEKWAAEEARVAGHRKALGNAAKRLKGRLVGELVAMDRLAVDTDRFRVRVQYAAPTVLVSVTPEELPPAYRREIPATVAAEKADLLRAAKACPDGILRDESGREIASLVAGTPFLRIR